MQLTNNGEAAGIARLRGPIQWKQGFDEGYYLAAPDQ